MILNCSRKRRTSSGALQDTSPSGEEADKLSFLQSQKIWKTLNVFRPRREVTHPLEGHYYGLPSALLKLLREVGVLPDSRERKKIAGAAVCLSIGRVSQEKKAIGTKPWRRHRA